MCNHVQVVNESKCDILILLILSINFTYLLNLRQSDAEHTPRLRATLFSALFLLPQLPYTGKIEK